MYYTSQEADILDRIDRSRGLTSHPEFNSIIKEWSPLKSKEDNFLDVYPEEEIARDKKTIENIKKSDKYEVRPELAIFIESALMEIINSNNALGEGVNVYPASEYDDLVNSTDFIIRLPGKRNEEFFYLAVDVTISEEPGVLANKMKKTAVRLEQNTLNEIKYFDDDEREIPIKGRILIPRVVISITGERLKRIEDGLLKKRSYTLDDDIRQELIDEIRRQLEQSTAYLLRNFYERDAGSKIESIGILNYYTTEKKNIEDKLLRGNVDKLIGPIDYFKKAKNLAPEKY